MCQDGLSLFGNYIVFSRGYNKQTTVSDSRPTPRQWLCQWENIRLSPLSIKTGLDGSGGDICVTIECNVEAT